MKRGTPDHPKMLMLCMHLEKIYAAHHKKASFGGRAEAIGMLEILWEWTSKYAIQGDVGKWPDEVIAQGIGWTFSAKELISSLIESRWLDRAPEPHRLVIHDIKDHATNTWRQNLQDAGLTWWDGSSPRKYKLRKTPEALQKNSRKSPQPEPETEPETEPHEHARAASPGEKFVPDWPRCQSEYPGLVTDFDAQMFFLNHRDARRGSEILRRLGGMEGQQPIPPREGLQPEAIPLGMDLPGNAAAR